jgi:hypothetical protein
MEADAAGIWDEEEPPVVIHPMGVVDSAGKDRMIVNGRYLNMFLQALPFKYERLRDLLAFTTKGSFMATWDLKSGYFHVPIHKDLRKYFCFKVGGVIFYFKVLCFGFAQACYVFTKVMQEPAIELRRRGVPLSDYIDDSFTAARTRGRCLRQSVLAVLFFATLGAFMGLPKCNLWPQLLLKWLGFIVDSQEESFKVGKAKMQKLKKVLEEAIDKPSTSPRKIAEIAGKILALSPAVLLAALYSRSFYSALKGRSSWDEVFPNPTAVKESAQFWLNNIDRFNGRKWWPKAVRIEAAVDASGVGYGGLISMPGKSPVPFTRTFSQEQASQSSTAREVRGYAGALAAAVQTYSAELKGAALLIEGDNQGAISAVNHLRSPVAEINEELQTIFRICCENGVDVVARWMPGENFSEADALLRLPDPTDWGLSQSEMQKIICQFQICPTLDLFASGSHHVAAKFVSRFFTPGCFAVDATKLDWSSVAGPDELAWVFSPNRLVNLALSMLESSKVRALVCLPIKAGSNELIQLRQMQGAMISAPYLIPRHTDSCIPSMRVLSGTLNPALLELGVVLVSWVS